jgi:hypothetical protein
MFQALEPFRKEVVVDGPNKDYATVVKNFFSCYKKYQHKEPSLITKQAHTKIVIDHEEVTQVVLSYMCMWLTIYQMSYS